MRLERDGPRVMRLLLLLGGSLLGLFVVGGLLLVGWLGAQTGNSAVPGEAGIYRDAAEVAALHLLGWFGLPGVLALIGGLGSYLGWKRSRNTKEIREAQARADGERYLRDMQK